MRRPLPLVATALSLTLTACGTEPAPADPLAGLIVVGEDPTDNPLPGLSDEWQRRFDEGDVLFEHVFRESEGLGPLFIRRSCGECHADDAKGPGKVTKMVVVEEDGITPAADQSLLPYGHTVRAQLAAGAATPVTAPDEPSVRTSLRIGPAVFGRGWMEAIRDDEIERVEAEQQGRDDGISGRIHRVAYASEPNPESPFHDHAKGQTGLVGRFGLKARIATIDEFSADAYQGDMGMTSPLRPAELPNPDGLADDARAGVDLGLEEVNLTSDYVRLLRIPTRGPLDEAGRDAFAAARCDVCHVPSLRTRDDHPIPQLAGKDAEVYTDLLLHDMGETLADALPDGDASGSEWRTAPLIGLRHLRNYLHDGRARTLDEAIRMHAGPGSEANDSVARYEALSEADREALLRFLAGL